MRLAFIALLVLVLAVLLYRASTRERRDYGRFKRLTSTRARQRVYARWLTESLVVLGGLSAVLLIATWPVLGPALRDAQAWSPFAVLRQALGTPLGAGIGGAIGILFVAALVVPVLLARGQVDEVPTVGDVQALLPRNRDELRFGAGLAVTAGIVEEALFRLSLPALIFGIIGDGPIAFATAAIVFGLLHLYQGPAGMTVAMILGVVLAVVYIATGWILVPMALHALLDLRSLVLIPAVIGTAWKKA